MLAWAVPVLIMGILGSHAFAQEDGLSITAPPNISEEATGYFTSVDIGTASASGSSGIEITNDAPRAFIVGETIVHWLATDEDGNRAVATQTITITDTTPPYFVDPKEEIVKNNPSPRPAPVHFDKPQARDLADIDVKVTSSHKSGQKFKVGNTPVTFTATDDSGNKATVEIPVILNDTSPKIQNLVVTPYNSFIHVTWDPLDGHDEYRVVLTETETKEKAATLTTTLTSYYFSELKQSTKYTVAVSALGDVNTKVKENTSTQFIESSMLDEFEDIDAWEFRHVFPASRGGSTYEFGLDQSVGNPVPSAKISGDSGVVNTFTRRTLDLTGFKAGDLFIGIDYKIDHTKPVNINFRISELEISGGGDRLYSTVLSSAGSSDNGWKTFKANVTSYLEDARLVRLEMHTSDYSKGDGDTVINLDNFRLYNVQRDN
ncbi:MAG: HYR domain-containing protein [Nitrosopumilus sp.]|nr:HYR domain-containing protein [Nitrosopumilus sp.]